MENVIKLNSIGMLHDMLEYRKPKHPHITYIDLSNTESFTKYLDRQIICDFYTISLKKAADCKLRYGRQYYDFSEGSMMFTAPGQVIVVESESDGANEAEGWMLCFHPDLIRKSSLMNKMNDYSFFNYNSCEALHLSDQEKATVNSIFDTIRNEFMDNIDIYTQDLIVSNIEVLLNYAKRFYGRQFITRSNENKDTISRFEALLNAYFESNHLTEKGIPSVKFLAKQMGYSTNYLSDLLKKETGKNTQDHIHFYLIEKAKSLLLGTDESISQIAYSLGYEYPAHFSKFFKKKTGMSPLSYRN